MTLCQNCGKNVGRFSRMFEIRGGKKICKDCFDKICFGNLCQEKELNIADRIINFLSSYFGERHAKELFYEEMRYLDIDTLSELEGPKLNMFIDDFIKDVFGQITSLNRQAYLKSKLMSILDVRVENDRWQSKDSRSLKLR